MSKSSMNCLIVKFDVGRTLKAGIRFEKKHEQNNRAASRVVISRFQVIFF